MSLPYSNLGASSGSASALRQRKMSHGFLAGVGASTVVNTNYLAPASLPSSTASQRTVAIYREEQQRQRRKASNCSRDLGAEVSSVDFFPEDLAAELTLDDQAVFRAISSEELNSCSWNKKNKLVVAPNVVASTRRFNHVSFWTIEEVLKRETPKYRGEVMAHFIKVAKRLHELNNLHSEFAILSALQSVPLYRLSKTWSCLQRKDRQTFEKLTDLFSENDNFARLRDHMDGIALKHQPCVPYLGLYLTDLVYVDMAHPHSGGLEPPQRQIKMNNILRIIAELQQTGYSNLTTTVSRVQCNEYLKSIRYIDELQKFVEDDQWKRSLQIEPEESNSTASGSVSSKDSCQLTDPNLMAELNLSPAKGMGCISHSQKKFVPGHRKSRSDGGSIFFSCGRMSFMGSNDNVSQQSGKSEDSEQCRHRHHLLDDSLLDSPAPERHHSEEAILCPDNVRKSHSLDRSLLSTFSRLSVQSECIFQSMIRRKPLIKDGRRLTMAGWQRYWIELWGSFLVYYSSKTITKSDDRKDYKSDPCKCQSIGGWFVMVPNSPSVDCCCFQLADPVRRNVYKFRAPSMEVARIWIHSLQESVRAQPSNAVNTNLISFE